MKNKPHPLSAFGVIRSQVSESEDNQVETLDLRDTKGGLTLKHLQKILARFNIHIRGATHNNHVYFISSGPLDDEQLEDLSSAHKALTDET